MTDKEKIRELERRVKELENLPVVIALPVIVNPIPVIQPIPQPFYPVPYQPWWTTPVTSAVTYTTLGVN